MMYVVKNCVVITHLHQLHKLPLRQLSLLHPFNHAMHRIQALVDLNVWRDSVLCRNVNRLLHPPRNACAIAFDSVPSSRDVESVERHSCGRQTYNYDDTTKLD